jgi:hypothetical protein
MKPLSIYLKSGEILNGIGRFKSFSNEFKFKLSEDSKVQNIEYSKIDYIKIPQPANAVMTYNFFQLTDTNEYVAVQKIVSGNKVELYTTSFNYNASGAGGISFNQSVVNYYIKKVSDEKLTSLGPYSTLTNDLRGKALKYFSDCNKLVEKIENREFKVREGLEKMVIFYNESCN